MNRPPEFVWHNVYTSGSMPKKKTNTSKKDPTLAKQEAARKKNMKIAQQTIGPTPSGNKDRGKVSDEQQSDGSADAGREI